MKKIIAFALAMAAVVSMAACGESVTLVNKSVNGISMDLPSNLGEFKDTDGTALAQGPGVNVSVMAKLELDTITREMLDQETFAAGIIGDDSVEFVQYDNNTTCAGIPAIRADFKGKNNDGKDTITYSYMLFHPDAMGQVIIVACTDESGNFAKDNIDKILSSIKIA